MFLFCWIQWKTHFQCAMTCWFIYIWLWIVMGISEIWFLLLCFTCYWSGFDLIHWLVCYDWFSLIWVELACSLAGFAQSGNYLATWLSWVCLNFCEFLCFLDHMVLNSRNLGTGYVWHVLRMSGFSRSVKF